MRADDRRYDELRPVRMTPGYIEFAEGSVLIEMGKTRVLCNVTIEDGTPRWMQIQNTPGGWVTGEYAMLPRATFERTRREINGLGGRTQEIRRLIGRSLRAGVDLKKLGARTCTIDCDVIQADGGTRTASITGGYLALAIALNKLIHQGVIPPDTLTTPVTAVSVGIVDGETLLDLDYSEDSRAEVDVNVVMTGRYEFIEVQGTAEGHTFTRQQLDEMLDLASIGIHNLLEVQQGILETLQA